MKKFVACLVVLGLASVSSASLMISVDGVVDPPDTQITLKPSEHVMIDIHGADNGTVATAMWLLAQGPGTINGGDIVYVDPAAQSELTTLPAADWEAALGFKFEDIGYPGTSSASFINIVPSAQDSPALDGVLVDYIDFHCAGLGDVILTLTDGNVTEVFDRQVIHQIPEPMTMGLLGLGGLGLLRRRRS